MSRVIKSQKRLSFIELMAVAGNLALLGGVALIMATV